MSDTEGKIAWVATSELGQRASFNFSESRKWDFRDKVKARWVAPSKAGGERVSIAFLRFCEFCLISICENLCNLWLSVSVSSVVFCCIVATFDLPKPSAACQGSDREPELGYLLWNFSCAVLLHCSAAKVWGVWRKELPSPFRTGRNRSCFQSDDGTA
jgi:hypothetical protein